MLSILSGYKRYAHIAALRCDSVLPELLGMNKIVSEDAVRRAFAAIDEDEGAVWARRHLDYCTAPLLSEPWILDIDTLAHGWSSMSMLLPATNIPPNIFRYFGANAPSN
jgi:hypothetical protein